MSNYEFKHKNFVIVTESDARYASFDQVVKYIPKEILSQMETDETILCKNVKKYNILYSNNEYIQEIQVG